MIDLFVLCLPALLILAVLIYRCMRESNRQGRARKAAFERPDAIEQLKLEMHGEGVLACVAWVEGDEDPRTLQLGLEAVETYLDLLESCGGSYKTSKLHFKRPTTQGGLIEHSHPVAM